MGGTGIDKKGVKYFKWEKIGQWHKGVEINTNVCVKAALAWG